jgi:hypothetical protein
MGATTNLFPAMTLGSRSAGAGITTDNVSPMNLIYIRKVGYGVRKIEEITNEGLIEEKAPTASVHSNSSLEDMQILKNILINALADKSIG